jgi:hypothetical protein
MRTEGEGFFFQKNLLYGPEGGEKMSLEYSVDGGQTWNPVASGGTVEVRVSGGPTGGPTLGVTYDGTYLNFVGDGFTSGGMADVYCDNVEEFSSSVEASADYAGHFMASWRPSMLSPPVLAGTHAFYAVDAASGAKSNTVILTVSHD